MNRKLSAWVILLFLALTVGAMLHAFFSLRIDTGADDLISNDLAFRRSQSSYEQMFPRVRSPLIAVVDAPSPERADQAADELAARLVSETGLFDEAYRPDGGEFFNRHGLLFLSIEELERQLIRLADAQPFLGSLAADPSARGLAEILVDAIERLEETPADTMARLLDALARSVPDEREGARIDEMSWRRTLAGDPDAEPDTRRIIQLRPSEDAADLRGKVEFLDAVHTSASALGLDRLGVRVRVTGPIALAKSELDSVMRGLASSGPISGVLVGAMLFIAMRSFALVSASVLTLLVGLTLTLGFASLAVGRLNLISVAFGVLYIGLGADFAIHLALNIRARRAEGFAPDAALRAAVLDVGGSLGLCALTTMIGFFVFIPTDFDGVSELGLIAGVGMVISFATALFLFPALMAFLPSRWRTPRTARPSPRLLRILHMPENHRAPILAFAGLIVLISGIMAFGLRFDPDPLNLRDPESEPVLTLRELRESNASAHWRLTSLAPDAELALDLRDRLAGSPLVENALWIGSFIPDRQDEKLAMIDDLAFILGPTLDPSASHAPGPTPEESVEALEALRASLGNLLERGGAPASVAAGAEALHHRLDDWLVHMSESSTAVRLRMLESLDRAWLGTFPLLLERIGRSLLAERITIETLPDAIRERWLTAEGTHRVEALPANKLDDTGEMRAFIDEVNGIAPQVVGSPIMHVKSGDVVVSAFQRAMSMAIIAVLVITLLAFRSVLTMLETIAPFAVGAIVTLAVMAAFDHPFNFANIIALPLLMGVGVDSSIHLVHRSKAGTHDRLLESATARGVLFSALTTIAGFGSLAFSPHRGMASMGFVLSVGMISMLISTLVILPALLSIRAPNKRH